MNDLEKFMAGSGSSESQVMMMCVDRGLISDNCESIRDVFGPDAKAAADALRSEIIESSKRKFEDHSILKS